MSFSADISASVHNFNTLLEGKSTFSAFAQEEGAIVVNEINTLTPVVKTLAMDAWNSLKAGASVLVGAGETLVGPILSETTDQQAVQVENLLQLVGVRPVGPLSIAEHAALVTLINGLKAGLDRAGLHIALARGVSAGATVAPAPAAAAA